MTERIVDRLREDKEDIIRRYESGESTITIAKDYNCHASSVRILLIENDIPRRKSCCRAYGNSYRLSHGGFIGQFGCRLARRTLPHVCYKCGNTEGIMDAHHLDHDRTNNDLSNFVILCHSCHSKLHHGTIALESD